jgi:AmiR/NasT family two-component response regulator
VSLTPEPRNPLRIVVADDAVLLREGLVRLLAEDGHQVVAAVGDAPALVEAVLRHRPDVSVVDVRMPPSHTDEGRSSTGSAPPPPVPAR